MSRKEDKEDKEGGWITVASAENLPPVEYLPPGRYYDSNHHNWPTDAEIIEARRKMREMQGID